MNMFEMSATKRGEQAEMAAWESVWDAAPAAVRQKLGLSKERVGNVLVLRAANCPVAFFNRILGLGLDEPADRSWLEEQLETYAAAGVPYGVGLCREARPAEISGWLEAGGLRKKASLAKMMRSTDQLPSEDLRTVIREVGIEEANLFAKTAAAGFGVPDSLAELFEALPGREGWRFYLSFDAGEAVGTGALFVRGDVAWIGFGSTIPSHRHRHLHGAMMAHRMHVAADLGCRWLITETDLPHDGEPAPSFHNMQRLGFELAYERANFVADQT
ncbi:hypothetical protein [Brucella sp. IR073]|uniref:hypothetical protein n=1 Tax=unclassified Brucella TaxID=2632610 RepID=UPI003B982153